MPNSDALLQIGFLVQFILFIYSFWALKTKMKAISTEFIALKNDLIRITTDFKALSSEFEKAKRDISQFDEKGFTHLANRITEAVTKCTEIDHEVRALDTSLKTFYSTWARKLGILSEKANKAAEAEKDDPQIVTQMDQSPASLKIHTPAARASGWPSQKRRVG